MKLHTDAARDDNVVGIGWAIVQDGMVVTGKRYMLGDYTSMEAEFQALVEGLRQATRRGAGEIEIYTDCEPLVHKIKDPTPRGNEWDRRRDSCHWLLEKFDDWSMEWTPRNSNESADRLAYEALEQGRRQR